MSAAWRPPTLAGVSRDHELVGRKREVGALRAVLDAAAQSGSGSLVLVTGEAGVGKSRLTREVLGDAGLRLLEGEATQQSTPPYGPIVSALRSFLRVEPNGLAACGPPLRRQLAVLLPELGRTSRQPDGVLLLEALKRAFEVIAAREPAVVFLDDLQWADETTLEDVLPALARSAAMHPLVLVGVYRSDEIPRGHPLRSLRRHLRRSGELREVVVEPLDADMTARLVSQVLGRKPAPELAAIVYERTHGVPFFVEEFAATLASGDRLHAGRRGLELRGRDDVPVPQSIRETIQARVERLSDAAQSLLEVAAVAGQTVSLDLLSELVSDEGLGEALDFGILGDESVGAVRFRHALTREALYADIPWTRRRTLHARIAKQLEIRRAEPGIVAEHWLAARNLERACSAFLEAVEASCRVQAHRDALVLGRRALEVWPDGTNEYGRLALLELTGTCALMCSNLVEAASAWRELAERQRLLGDSLGQGQAERQLATTYELQGSPERALVARRQAAASFAAGDRPAEAAEELLAAAAQLDSAGHLNAALDLLEQATASASRADRLDLRSRALGIEGTVRAKLGHADDGLSSARAALELALAADLTGPAADAYQRIANVLENAGDYDAAWDAYQAGLEFCEARGMHTGAQVCLVCLAAILVFTGEWDRALELDRVILESEHAGPGARMGAKQHMGLIGAARGETKRSRRLLTESGTYASLHTRERMEAWDAMGQAWIDELEGAFGVALDRCSFILDRWRESESLHYPAPALRWATTFCATHGAEEHARACAGALSRLAAQTLNPETVAALSHALGEVLLLDGDAGGAGGRFEQALAVLEASSLPYEAAQTHLRAGVAFVAAGEREQGIGHLTNAYRIARRLGARPLADRAAGELAGFGEQVDRRLGRRAAARLDGPGLTRRELEIVRLVATGKTNREIARQLFLSTRTVDMHVRNVLRKLNSRSRAEATRKAADLDLLS
jgi:predicted ATPase/DNA-binding CsgD family transcriptional regulator